jgi:ribonuclease VapC
MIVDSSVLIAVLKNEDDAALVVKTLASADSLSLSAANYLEAGIVADRHLAPADAALLDKMIAEFQIEIVPVTADQAYLARKAYRDFGNHSNHPAKLNFGDCFAYALAKSTGEPLLFKGGDFAQTDVARALPT